MPSAVAQAPEESERLSSRFYRPELDSLRFGAFLAVFFYHVAPDMPEDFIKYGFREPWVTWGCAVTRLGASGVDLFFALSAFLITEILLRERERNSSIDVPAFYARRVLRIWPLYFAFLGFSFAVTPILIQGEHFPLRYFVAYAFFVGNWAVSTWGAPPSTGGVLWSVSVEEQFYLAWPWLIRRFSLRVLAPLMMLTALVARLWFTVGAQEYRPVYFATLPRLDPIALGAVTCVLLRRTSWRPSGVARTVMATSGVASMLIAARFSPMFDIPHSAGAVGLSGLAAAGVCYPVTALGACMIVASCSYPMSPPPSLLRSRPLVYLGRISYGLYVFHPLAVRLCMSVSRHLTIFVPMAFALTVLFASISYRFLEAPFLRLKARRFEKVSSAPVNIQAGRASTRDGGEGSVER